MARVAVLHNTLDLRGGADAVCLHVCEALQADHDVSLFTLSRSTPAELNRLYGTNANVPIRTPPATSALNHVLDGVAAMTGPLLPLRSVLLDRYFRRSANEFDLAVSTANEFATPLPSVQYVHYPQFNLDRIDEGGRLNPLFSRLAGIDRLPDDGTMLANSNWTADVVERIYGRRPDVLHPPVSSVPTLLPWEEREDGFVVLGRIAPDKRVFEAIRIVEEVRRRGHDVHLHVVGSVSPNNRTYVRRVERAIHRREWARLDCDLPRSRVDSILGSHRYGINAKPDEHFGMAVAEFLEAGMVAFARDSGGAVDILDGDPGRLFGSESNAVETIDAALGDGVRPSPSQGQFHPERFRRRIRRSVEERVQS